PRSPLFPYTTLLRSHLRNRHPHLLRDDRRCPCRRADWRRSAMIRHEELGLLRPPLHLYWTGARFTMHLLRVLFFTGLLLASCKRSEEHTSELQSREN